MKKILFITTSSLAANPRLVKEFEMLQDYFQCFVLCFKHQDWSLMGSEAIISSNPKVHFIVIDRHTEVFRTIVSKAAHNAAILSNSLFKTSFHICAFASNDKSLQLWNKTKSLRKSHDFVRVIAHNLGAFYPAVKLSKTRGITLQLDIEDFYPGEALYFNQIKERQNRIQLMAQSFLKADAITYASEGIALECQKQFNIRPNTEQITILNAFMSKDFKEPVVKNPDYIKCVWFSQHIGPNRGLEQIFSAAEKLTEVQFHLIGNANHQYLNTFELNDNIIFHDIMPQGKLHKFLSTMDIGLALEPGKDLNNTIAVSNKILAYAQAGLYILATDTFGQSQFLNSFNYNAGKIINISLEETLQNLNMNLLRIQEMTNRWRKAKTFAWEREQIKLKNLLL